jgi:diketogulonate reductase-like aldo/keto reductase
MIFPIYPPHDYTHTESNCYAISLQNKYEGVNGFHAAAVTMHHRVLNLLRHASLTGFSRNAPSDFLFSYGVMEGVFYTLRLYEVVANASIQSRPPKQQSVNLLLPQDLLSSNFSPISASIKSLESALTYDPDALARTLYSSQDILETAKHELNVILNQTTLAFGGNNEVCLSAIGNMNFNFTTSLPHYLPSPNPSIFRNQPIQPSFLLSNGVQLPAMGLGTWQLTGEECEVSVYEAIRIGYRHIDTAQAYGNEKEIGVAITKAISDGLVTREELFIATKLSFDSNIQSEDDMVALVTEQMRSLQIDYIDLYYLHSPIRSEDIFNIVWIVLDRFYRQGIIRVLGISNFDGREIISIHQMISKIPITEQSNVVTPHVLQNKYDIYHPGRQLDVTGVDIELVLKRYQIQMVGYSPFSSFPFTLLPLLDPILKQLTMLPSNTKNNNNNRSNQSSRSPADLIIQWMLQRGVAVIPRSKEIRHLEQNLFASRVENHANGFALTEDEMRTISSISSLLTNPFFKHLE